MDEAGGHTLEYPAASTTPKRALSPFSIFLGAFLFLVVSAFLFRDRTIKMAVIPPESKVAGQSTESKAVGVVDQYVIDGSNFVFSPNQIYANKGDTVKIIFKNDSGSHNLTIDGYNLSTKTIQSGDIETLQFVADKAGTFNFYCSVDSHREKGMTGTLVVQ